MHTIENYTYDLAFLIGFIIGGLSVAIAQIILHKLYKKKEVNYNNKV